MGILFIILYLNSIKIDKFENQSFLTSEDMDDLEIKSKYKSIHDTSSYTKKLDITTKNNPLIYTRAVDRNFIYYEPKVATMMGEEVLTSEEMNELNTEKNEKEIKNHLKKQIEDKKTLKNRRSILNYYNNKSKQKCLSGSDYCLFRGNNNHYCYKKPKNYCLIKGIKKEYCVEAIEGAKCPNSKNYNNPYCN